MRRFSDWRSVRESYERGERIRDLAHRFGITRRAIELRRKAESWSEPDRTVAADGRIGDYERPIVNLSNIEEVHRQDWTRMRGLHDRAIHTARTATSEEALTYARTVRLLLDGMRTIIQGENLAWGVEAGTTPPLESISDSELEAAISEASERIARAKRDGDNDNSGATIH